MIGIARGALVGIVAAALLAGAAPAVPQGGLAEQGRIAFARGVYDESHPQGVYGIWTIAPDGTRLARVTRSCGWDWFPAWSPDAKSIAFSRACGKDLDLWVVRADGSGLRRLVHTPTNDEWPTWSPDGKRIAFVSGEPMWTKPGDTRTPDLWVVGADGRGLRRLTRTAAAESAPAWSPDGRWIAFGRRGADDRSTIWLISPDTGSERTLRLRGGEVAWSPDGKRLAYARTRPGAARETIDLCVARTDGGGERLLLRERPGGVSHHVSWSPDGRFLVYMSSRGEPRGGLWLIQADGRNARRLTLAPGEDADPAWSGSLAR